MKNLYYFEGKDILMDKWQLFYTFNKLKVYGANVKILGGKKKNLFMTAYNEKTLNMVNLRSFKIPMANGLQNCSYFKELAEYFEEGEEINFYRNEKELIDKTNFYLRLENKKIRQQIKEAYSIRAKGDYTWFNRFNFFLNYFGLEYKREIKL